MIERLLIVGLGSIGTRHARIARQLLPGAEFIAWLHRPVDGMTPALVDRYVSSLDDALASRPQAAVIASPASFHLDAALPLAAAGVHLLVEKPIASTADRVDQLIEVCRVRRSTLMVGYNLRFLGSLIQLRRMLEDQLVGTVLSVRAEAGQSLPSWRPGTDYRQSVSARATLGGGVLLELSHEIDYLRWLFGDVEWVGAITRRQSSLEIDVEDLAHLTLGLAPRNGDRGLVAELTLDFFRHDATRRCTIVGERGTLRWDGIAGRIDLFAEHASGWTTLHSEPPVRDESYLREWESFLRCVATGVEPCVTGADGLATLRIIDAARKSANQGAVVSLIPSLDVQRIAMAAQ